MIDADIDLSPFDEHVARRLILGCKDFLTLRDGGVWPTQHSLAHVVNGGWRPCDELPEEEAATTTASPGLPIPFTAGQLAAFMVDGAGRSLSEYFGEIADGFEELVLAQFQDHEHRAAEAIIDAFSAYREATDVVGRQRLTTERTLCPRWRRSLVQRLLTASRSPNMRLRIADAGVILYDELASCLAQAQRFGGEGLSTAVNGWREMLSDAAEANQLIVRSRESLAAQPFDRCAPTNGLVVTATDLKSYLTSLGGLKLRAVPVPVPVLPRARARASGDVQSPWKRQARNRAEEIILEQSNRDLYPSQEAVADQIAHEFRKSGIVGSGGKPLTGSYIKRHALKGISSAVRQSPAPLRQ